MAAYPELVQAIAAADGQGAAAAFCSALAAGAPARDLVAAAVAAAAPRINHPYHMYLDADGRLLRREVNHASLGLGAAIELAAVLPPAQQALPLAWAVAHLATGCREQPPPWLAGATPLHGDMASLTAAVLEGRPNDAYRLWLGLAADPAARPELREQLRFCGAINLEESVDRQLRYLGHKAIFAENTLTLLDYLGWEAAPTAGLPGIAFLATGPQLFPVYDLLWSRSLFPMAEVLAENSFELDPEDQAALERTILRGDREHLILHLSDLINAGRSLAAVGSSVAVAAANLVLETSPDDWYLPTHGLTYAAVLNRWVRQGNSPLRVYAPCLSALLVNDISHYYRRVDYTRDADLGSIPAGDPVSRTLAAVAAGEMAAASRLALEHGDVALVHALCGQAARWGAEVHTLKLAATVGGEYAQSSAAGKNALPAALARHLALTNRGESVTR